MPLGRQSNHLTDVVRSVHAPIQSDFSLSLSPPLIGDTGCCASKWCLPKVPLELKEPTNAKQALAFFHWSAQRKMFEHGNWSYWKNSRSTLPNEGDGRSGFEVYSECFDLIIEGCAKAGKLEESLMHCEKMLERRLVPSCWAFNEMVGKLSEIGNLEQANAVLIVLLDRGFLPDEITYSHLIEGYGKKKVSFIKFSNSTMKLRIDHCLLNYWSMRH
ncbi:hypothetical protein CMV_024659 [Castanea mollissima]|uniref:Pentatricopeptide repeat-containing protein n=1 Tax=Castanea mollissima TaxID=60419 RepID=A0A8J4QMT1_9ROSI|nr:hypothetical protein CMV_024659 [Castanea mollissima]